MEQKARQTLKLADRAYLMETGRVAACGLARDLARDSLLSQSFLGGHAEVRDESGLEAPAP